MKLKPKLIHTVYRLRAETKCSNCEWQLQEPNYNYLDEL